MTSKAEENHPVYKEVLEQARRAKESARLLACASAEQRDAALCSIAQMLLARSTQILDANSKDVDTGKTGGLSASLLERLSLSPSRISAMADGLRQIVSLPDPLGRELSADTRPNGLHITRISVPIGVIGIIYESRPNVTVDSAGLCLKSGNACILRGGSEAIHTNMALAGVIASGIAATGLPAEAVQLIESTDRGAAVALMQADGLVDLIIPRGGDALKKTVVENARVPVLTSYGGNCHTYIDSEADLKMAEQIAFNAKVSRPSVCNAMETLLVHADIATQLLPDLIARFTGARVEVRGCEKTREVCPGVAPATEKDWETEYLDLILAIRVVNSIEEAIEHINRYGSGHSEAIVTRNRTKAELFTGAIDAACVFVNASTRFTDGFEFGFGAEIGISTQKLHARGPIGLRELTTYKTIVAGEGQIRA
jgi:glutamate-5-semialdehyde dehydrogenase